MHPNKVAPRHPVSLQTITLSQPTGRAPTSQESTSHQRSQSRVRPPQVPLVDVRNQAPWALARGAPSRVLRRVFCSTVPRGCSRKHPSVELRELARARTDASPGTRRCSSLSCAPSAGDGWSLCNDDIDKTSLAVQSQSQKRERPLPSSRAACARNVFPACPPLVHPLVRRTACAAVAALLLGLVALSRFCHVWETRSLAEISRKHTISPGHGTSPNRVNPPLPFFFCGSIPASRKLHCHNTIPPYHEHYTACGGGGSEEIGQWVIHAVVLNPTLLVWESTLGGDGVSRRDSYGYTGSSVLTG